MDKSQFTENAPGRLVRISFPRHDWSFIPNEMPTNWVFDNSLWPLLVEARTALGELNGVGQNLPNPQLLLRPLQSREALTSSSLEGTFVTPEQLLLFELDPREPKPGDNKALDWFEVFNYSQALIHGCEVLRVLPVGKFVIREMHKILLQGVRGRDKSPGEFRSVQVQIGSNARFVPPPPEEVVRLLDDLEGYVQAAESYGIDPLVQAYMVHYQFEAIHPFKDGNGRVGRALLALMIYKWLGHSMPWLYMSAFFEKYKDEYIQNLFRVSTHGDWTRWLEFCLRGTIDQAKDSTRRCNEFIKLRDKYHNNRAISHSSRTHRIIDDLFTNAIVTVVSVKKRFGIHYNTAKSDLQRLVDSGVLTQFPNLERTYYAKDIMNIAYHDEVEAS